MDYDILLDFAEEIGYKLSMAGAETFRVEDSINRIMRTYGVQSEVFAIPNNLTISIRTEDGRSVTRMKRIGFHGTDLDAVERYNSLSRRICSEKPDPNTAMQWLKETNASRVNYKTPAYLLGSFLAASGFAVFFGGTLLDAFCAGICGVCIGFTELFLKEFKTNQFFRTIACAFIMTVIALCTGAIGIADNADMAITGTLMILVPGLVFTNAMRDIIFGDTNSGVNRIVQVFLVAAAIALGTGVGWSLSNLIFGTVEYSTPIVYSWLIECVACFISCIGFSFIFNIQGPGKLLCALGAFLSWAVFCLCAYFGLSDLVCYFISTLVAASYAETMARIRKYPAISYLVISIFPLIPGFGIYTATNYLVIGDMSGFAKQSKFTLAIAGVIAVGILTVSTVVRLWNEWKQHRKKTTV